MIDWLSIYDSERDLAEPKAGEQVRLFDAQQAVTRLRQYQEVATERCLEALDSTGSTLLVMATGLGKTEVICEVIKRWSSAGRGRVLCLAHRDELVAQLRDRIELRTYLRAYVEKGPEKAPPWADVVVASIDTIKNKRRLELWPRDHFSLIIVDEVHHYVGNTYERPFMHFGSALRMGVTATPKRHDKKALGKWFSSYAMNYGIADAIDDGYLVPITTDYVLLKQLDLSKVDVKAGDFVRGQLDEAMVKAVEPMVKAILEHHPKDQVIAFFPGVRTAEAACARFNALEPDSACFIDGETPLIDRRRMVEAFKARRVLRLCNCGIAVEGFDAPETAVIALGRPTKSVGLITQMIGRGTRVLPGIIDELTEHSRSAERKAAIAASAKPRLHVMDFRGICSPAMLATPTDVLGGRFSEAERALAKKKVTEKPGRDVLEALREAREEIKRQMASVNSSVVTALVPIDLFAICKLKKSSVEYLDKQVNPKTGLEYGHEPATGPQRDALKRFGCTEDDVKDLSKRTARRMLDELWTRSKRGLATVKQLKLLAKEGLCDTSLTRDQASRAIGWMRERWNRGLKFDAGQLAAVASGIRPPEDLRRSLPTSTEYV